MSARQQETLRNSLKEKDWDEVMHAFLSAGDGVALPTAAVKVRVTLGIFKSLVIFSTHLHLSSLYSYLLYATEMRVRMRMSDCGMMDYIRYARKTSAECGVHRYAQVEAVAETDAREALRGQRALYAASDISPCDFRV
jgi:hypothetical protein